MFSYLYVTSDFKIGHSEPQPEPHTSTSDHISYSNLITDS